MPYLKIETNVKTEPAQQAGLLQSATDVVATALGKPASYVMVSLQPGSAMLFAGSDAPLAYLELKSLGLPRQRTAELSAALSALITEVLGVDNERIYIEFSDVERSMWGWKGSTF